MPVAFCTMAESMYVAEVLYRKWVPGLKGTGWARKARVQGVSGGRGGSAWCPVDIRRRSLTRMDLRLLLGSAGTSSSRLSFPSAMARPTAVEVKLLLSEKREWRASASYGAHQPSATTRPCRTSMRLWSASMSFSAASTNARIAEDEIPCASGLLL